MARTSTKAAEQKTEAKRMTMKCKIDEGGYKPVFAHTWDAGADIFTPEAFSIHPRGSATIDTKVHLAIPEGYVGVLKSKSGLNVKFDLTGDGVIDSGYTGSIVCKLYNNGGGVYHFNKGDKIIQILFTNAYQFDFEEVEELEETERGSNGFGSTGR